MAENKVCVNSLRHHLLHLKAHPALDTSKARMMLKKPSKNTLEALEYC